MGEPTHNGASAYARCGRRRRSNPVFRRSQMAIVHHRYATVDGHRLFYREAGDAEAPVLVLLHGFPTSSHMFRHLLPALADEYRVIAPDHLGFGLSDAPPVDEFDYTFDALAALTAAVLGRPRVARGPKVVEEYGVANAWRLGLGGPEASTATITPKRQPHRDPFALS